MNTQTQVQDELVWHVADLAISTANLLAFGKSQGWRFCVMEHHGVINHEILKSDWVFEPDSNTNVTPQKEEAYKRLKAVIEAGFPIKQVIYGYQVKAEKKPLLSDETKETIKRVAGATLAGLGLLAVGAAVLVFYSAMTVLSADPLLAVVIDDGKDSWVCLHSWDEF